MRLFSDVRLYSSVCLSSAVRLYSSVCLSSGVRAFSSVRLYSCERPFWAAPQRPYPNGGGYSNPSPRRGRGE